MSNEGSAATLARLELEFQLLAEAMKNAAAEENHHVVADEAVKLHMDPTAPSRGPSSAWQKIENGLALWFQWRYYDQSHPFSIQKDMNILSLELREGEKVLKRAEERFEDD